MDVNTAALNSFFAVDSSASPRPAFVTKLAHGLNWGFEGNSRLVSQQPSGLEGISRVEEAKIGDESAVLFLGHRYKKVEPLISEAASFAYQRSVEWCVLTNYVETHLINSHWLRSGDWFTLDLTRERLSGEWPDLFEGLTPSGVRTGKLENVVYEIEKPDTQVAPIDEALFERLDYWREETLRHVPSMERVDEALHLLFVQLFVLRVVEDRRLAQAVPLLQEIERADDVRSFFDQVFIKAKEEIQSSLFAGDALKLVPDFILRGIVQDLYRPQHLPRGTRYNFSWIDTELLGQAYEKYVSAVLVPARSRTSQLQLFNHPIRDIERRSRRKSYGVYYTPGYLVRHLTSAALDLHFESRSNGQESMEVPTVIDMACGSGAFLVAAADKLIATLRGWNAEKNWGRYLVEKKKILGIDIDERAVSLARLNLWLRLTREPDPLPLPQLEEAIVAGDSLSKEVWERLPKTIDVGLGNPPFLAVTGVPNREELQTRFKTADGRFDYSHLFLEQYVSKVAVGGTLALVVPNRIYRNRDASSLRAILGQSLCFKEIGDFGSAELFPGTSAYVGVFVAKKKECDSQEFRFSRFKRLPPRFPGSVLRRAFASKGEQHEPTLQAYDVTTWLGSDPWLFLSPTTRRLRTQLEQDAESLGSVARIQQGIKTGANDIFVVEVIAQAGGGLAEVENGLGDRFMVESQVLKPVTYGSAIKRYELVRPTQALIYPYGTNGERLEENEVKGQFPRCWEYFLSIRHLLEGRSSIHSSGGEWYELVRKREVEWLESPKLLMRDLATMPSFALDDRGEVFLIGGTAVVPFRDVDPFILLAYLNSAISGWYLERVTPSFQSGYRKFEPQHLERMPVPKLLFDDSSACQGLRELVYRRLVAGPAEEEGIERDIDLKLVELLKLDRTEIL